MISGLLLFVHMYYYCYSANTSSMPGSPAIYSALNYPHLATWLIPGFAQVSIQQRALHNHPSWFGVSYSAIPSFDALITYVSPLKRKHHEGKDFVCFFPWAITSIQNSVRPKEGTQIFVEQINLDYDRLLKISSWRRQPSPCPHGAYTLIREADLKALQQNSGLLTQAALPTPPC